MRKRFRTCLVIPVVMEVEADDVGGEVNITDVCGVDLPTLLDIRESMSDVNIKLLNEDYSAS